MVSVGRSLRRLEPVYLRAEVVHGFGRGSRTLGFPTANLRICWEAEEDPSTLDAEELEVLRFARLHETGIYCALGRVEGFEEGDPAGAVHKVAMSMGWNPTFGDVKAKTIEPWILHEFKEDFYGRHLRLVVIGYVRPELKFDDMDELIREIKADGAFCREALDEPALAALAEDRFLRGADGRPDLPRAPPTVPAPPPCGPRWSADLRTALLDVPPLCPGSSRLLLVRHGEAVANEQGQLCGGTNDSELTPRGRAQAAELAAELAVLLPALGITLDLVGSSPLRRAVASADEVASRFPGAARAELEALREMEYGSLEGARIEEVRDEVAAVAKRWRDGETSHRVGGPAGESPQDVAERACRAARELLRGRAGRTALLVCHSWVNKIMIASASPGFGLKHLQEVPQRNCAVNVLDFRWDADADVQSLHVEVHGVDLVAAANGRL